MDFCWELVCYQLSGQDIGHVFQTCKDRRRLREKATLWNHLLRRDFPEHVQLVSIPEARDAYQDLYQFGGYYFLKQHEIEIYPERPTCMYIDPLKRVRKAVTYRKCGITTSDDLSIRYPFERNFAWEDSHVYSKIERKKLIEGNFLPLRGMMRGNELIVVSTQDIPKPKGQHLFVPAVRIPFSTGRDELEKWIFIHFNVWLLSWMPREEFLRLEGCLMDDNELSSHSKKLLVFKTCGEGGGMTGSKQNTPCKAAVSRSATAKFEFSPYYGRCKNHPREKDDPSIWKHKRKTFKTKRDGNIVVLSTFVFNKESISVFSGGAVMSRKFTHLNGQPVADLLRGWIEKDGKLEKYRLDTK